MKPHNAAHPGIMVVFLPVIALWPILGKFVQKLQRWIFYIDFTFLHTTGLIKHQESHKNKKKANKGGKG